MIRSHNRDYLDFIGFCDIRPVAAGAGRQGILQPQGLQRRRRQEAQAVRHQGGDVRRPRRRDDRDRPAALAARAGGDRGDEDRQARLHREADGATRSPSARRCARSPARPTGCWPSATSGITRCCTTTPITWSRTTSWATSATSGPSGTATTPSPWSPRTRTATRSIDPKTGLPEFVHDEKGKLVYRDSWKRHLTPEATTRTSTSRSTATTSLDELINWRLYNRTGRGLDGRAGQPPARRLLDLPGQEAPAGGDRHRRHVLLHRRPRGGRPRLHRLRVPRQGRERPGRRDVFVDQHQLVRRLRREGDGLEGDDDREPGEGDPALQGGGQPGRVEDDQRHGGDARARSRRWRPARARPGRRPRPRWGAWPRPTRRAATARSSSTSPTASATATQSDYHADKEHQPRCRGEVALADAVIALTSNIAMRQKRRIDFDPRWFDYQSPETPESAPSIVQRA